MKLLKTDKEILTREDILKYISDYDRDEVPLMDKLWAYYVGDNIKILSRKTVDSSNPDNKIPIPYGRKIVTTFTGYAYRPKYITYKGNIESDDSLEELPNEMESTSKEKEYVAQLFKTFNLNDEHIKTSRAGRNMAIFGVAYECLYIDGVIDEKSITVKAEPKFFEVDPREVILLYDFSPEPKKQIAIRYYRINDDLYKVDVYYKNRIEQYERKKVLSDTKWVLEPKGEYPNYFVDIPIVPYYFGDEMLGVIKPVLPLIDANDVLYSDSMNEFDRFAYAYLIMKKFGLTSPIDKKDPSVFSRALARLKQSRVFENIPADADIKFLTKDIPTGFMQWMATQIREQIHIQSHVPDFSQMTGALSGAAIDRLLFDFENMVASSEADFDTGLLERIRLITIIYKMTGKAIGTKDDLTISHKRNTPLNLMECAQTSVAMKNAGLSAYSIVDIWPDDVFPNIQIELERQRAEQEAMVGMNPVGMVEDNINANPNPNDEEVNDLFSEEETV